MYYIRAILERILSEGENNDKYSNTIQQMEAISLILQCARMIDNDGKESISTMTSTSVVVEKVTSYIQDNFSDSGLNLNSISRMNYLSTGYLSRIFKHYTGNTIYQYIIQCRLQNICQLISSGVRVTEACIQSGFTDYTCFLKEFKKTFNMTPREYLAELNEGNAKFI